MSSVEIQHLLAELTVDFTVLHIFLQVTYKTISKKNLKYCLSIGEVRCCLFYLVTEVNSSSCGKCYTIFQIKLC